MAAPKKKSVTVGHVTPARKRAILEAAEKAGLLDGECGRIGARIRRDLIAAAKEASGIASDTELLEFALATVALEDDFGAKLLALKGSVPRDIDLDAFLP